MVYSVWLITCRIAIPRTGFTDQADTDTESAVNQGDKGSMNVVNPFKQYSKTYTQTSTTASEDEEVVQQGSESQQHRGGTVGLRNPFC